MAFDFVGASVIIAIAVGLFAISLTNLSKSEQDERLKSLQFRYLTVYSLAVAADWLQGPYMYALYESYNLTVHEINLLFVGGFGASLFAGTVIGSFADKCGRKFNVMLYVALYIISCITKHSSSFTILFIGRITGGTATSILFSAFESWLIYEHKASTLSPDLLTSTFTYATLLNSGMAILSGFVAQLVVDFSGYYVSSFDASIVVLVVTAVAADLLWGENYGDVHRPLSETLKETWNIIISTTDRKPLFLGVAIALFEAAMYMFVLEWTPALNNAYFETWGATDNSKEPNIPYGLIFSAFMVACMTGSVIFKYLIRNLGLTAEHILATSVAVAVACLICPVIPGVSQNFHLVLLAFVVFEVCVGLFWPGTATLRSQYLPEESRCTIMNFYRIPLNAAVIFVLCFDLNYYYVFVLAVCCLGVSAIFFTILSRMATKHTNVETNLI